LAEVQRYPNDFDGVISGAPAMYSSARATSTLIQRAFATPATRLTDAQVRAVHREVLRACDALDGAVDGIIADPAKCQWDPAPLACGNGPDCLSPEQVDAVRLAYSVRRLPNGQIAAYGVAPGSELVTLPFFISMGKDYQIFTGYNKFGTAEGLRPGDDLTKNDVIKAQDIERNSIFGRMMRADDPDISPFIRHGGKLLFWNGMYDQLIPYRASIAYFTNMRRVTSAQLRAADEVDRLDDSARFFLAAGVTHCRGGDGPSDIDFLTALEHWVEQGEAPTRLLAKQPPAGSVPFPHTLPRETPDAMTRPLCAWPTAMHYDGKGDINDAANFSCQPPKSN
jgi:feruloyl esterase